VTGFPTDIMTTIRLGMMSGWEVWNVEDSRVEAKNPYFNIIKCGVGTQVLQKIWIVLKIFSS